MRIVVPLSDFNDVMKDVKKALLPSGLICRTVSRIGGNALVDVVKENNDHRVSLDQKTREKIQKAGASITD